MVADADLTLSIEERPIGGFGIFLIRRIMNEFSYQRLDGENRLIMKKSL
ncbi:ATP-binding protein [Bacteroides nordii]